MSMSYIRKTYDVPAKRGGRVRFCSPVCDSRSFSGTIIGSRGAHVRVRSDIDGRVYTLHPSWNLKYIEDASK